MIFECLWVLLASQVSADGLFSCEGRPAGYYADILSDCQKYHVCTEGRLHYTYSCPNTTRFQQRMMICDHDYVVDCSKSEQDFSANLLLGRKGVPFVSAGEFHSKRSLEFKSSAPPKTVSNYITPLFSNIRTFVTTVSPIHDFPISTKSSSQSWFKNANEVGPKIEENTIRRSRVKLEWTLPDTRAMLFIPDNPADAVEPNIKKYSVNIPQPKMVFKAEKLLPACPGNCNSQFLERKPCSLCVTVK